MTDDALARLPFHMHDFVRLWIEKGQPAPELLGSFARALLLHDFVGFFAHADEENSAHARDWALFLYNDAPGPCHGSKENLARWHAVGGLEGLEKMMGMS